jgi:LysR family transcriptional activator of dmlA
MLDRADLDLVLAIRAHGNLARAAAQADVVPSVITKRLAALESRLGQKLFHRTTRRVVPTPEGEVLCERAVVLLDGFRAAEAEMAQRQAEPAGRIRLAATLGFGRAWVGPAVAEFQSRHPKLQVQLELTERLPDLASEGYDGAVWLWSVRGARALEWSGRKLASNQRVLVAAPAYLDRRGTPKRPTDLAQHDCLVVREHDDRFDVWTLQHDKDGSDHRVRVQGPLSSNSGELVRDWCLAGRGIMLRSLWDVAGHLAAGRLRRVLTTYAMADADIHWLAPHQLHVPMRTRLLVDHLAQCLGPQPWRVRRGTPAPPG